MLKIKILDLRKTSHPSGCTQADLKYVLSERRVSVDTLKEEKHISDRLVKSEGAGILRKSSKPSFALNPKGLMTTHAEIPIQKVIRLRNIDFATGFT